MENKRKIRKRSDVFKMLNGRKVDDVCVRFTAKPERERIRDKVFGVGLVALMMVLALAGNNELIRTVGVVLMFVCSCTAFLA